MSDGSLPPVARVRIVTPVGAADGVSRPATAMHTHTVVEVAVTDPTFVVDSITAHLARRGIEVHAVEERTGDEDASGTSTTYRIAIDRETDPGVLARLRVEIDDVLDDVDAAVRDWSTMRDRVRELAASMRVVAPPHVSADDVDEVAAFLDWLADDHFTFVGALEYRVIGVGGDARLEPIDAAALGVARRCPLPAPGARVDTLAAPFLLTLTKAGALSTVHRTAPLDDVRVRSFDASGAPVGEWRFVGLYTASVFNDSATRIPVMRGKVARVLDAISAPRGSAAEQMITNVLETLPREELFRLPVDVLTDLAQGIATVGERRRLRLFATPDEFGRFVSCLVFLPRDRYTTGVRTGIVDALQSAFGATAADYSVLVDESVMARLHVVLDLGADRANPSPALNAPGVEALEAELVEIARAWSDGLRDALQAALGEEVGLDAFRRWGSAFPAAYQADVAPAEAVADLTVLGELDPSGDLEIRLAHHDHAAVTRLKLYRSGTPLLLSDVMPVLDHLDIVIVDERPYEVMPAVTSARETDVARWIYSFGIRAASGGSLDDPQLQTWIAELFEGVWGGAIENDALNRLVIAAGLAPSDVVIVRALAKYLHQAGVRFTEATLSAALVGNPTATRLVVELFHARLDPGRIVDATRIDDALATEIDAITSLDDDRILRAVAALVRSVVRTNAFLPGRVLGDRLACKLDPSSLEFLPLPRPEHEIWVYTPRVEGVHLRGGDIARGGIRWSDRRDDFRTEILGLMKAQTAKNAVIVPVGAKGGFVVKQPPADRQALAAELVECYRTFIRGLLDLTDNLVDGAVVHPPCGCTDGDDPYLVVAADKGTASFSDIANELAAEYGYWLGDAFASGGSSGYDHKAMGITARGAWISVKSHFRAMGIDADTAPLSVVGIGDMSGDVFGNGLLRSPHVRLLAAFDHRNVFLDPDPDPARSYAERQRLFDLPGSSWADYDPALISPGGGVYPRAAKSIDLSPEVRAVLAFDRVDAPATTTAPTPDDVVSAMLRAPVDLLWNGGIGTFVKATSESAIDVGDRANDAVRVNASELRCRVVGEGGNLGLTQAARVEYSLLGGRVYSDAIDNSAGVDCSDHEVNIKILLQGAIRAGDLDPGARDALLASMTDEVCELVLADNEAQANAIHIASIEAAELVGVHARQMERLERSGVIDRTLEGLPDAKQLQERIAARRGLTAPELGVLLAFTKIELQQQLIGSDVPDDPYFAVDLVDYFPTTLRERFGHLAPAHPLAREITATVVANAVVNRAGISFLSRLCDETGCPLPVIARAHVIARDVFDARTMWAAVDALDLVVPAATQARMFLVIRRLVERGARWFAREGVSSSSADALAIGPNVERYRPAVAEVAARVPELLTGEASFAFAAARDALTVEGVPAALAAQIAGAEWALGALDIANEAMERNVSVTHAAAVHFRLADRLRLDWFRARVAALPRADRWQTEARAALRDDVSDCARVITEHALASSTDAVTTAGATADARVDAWLAARADAVTRYDRTLDEIAHGGVFDLAELTAARRALRDLSEAE
ncbi:MAG: NAD-glutamate dehydrogenase [Acidimicrobiia bacterium]